MKKILLCFSLWLSYSCNNQQSATVETKPVKIPEDISNQATPFVDPLEAEKKKRENNPAYADSMKKLINQMVEKELREIKEKESKYSPEDWLAMYQLQLDDYLVIEKAVPKYNSNYETSLTLTISNRGAINIMSMELLAGNYSKFNDNTFIVKKGIPARTTVTVTVKVSNELANLPISIYSAISSSGDRFSSQKAN